MANPYTVLGVSQDADQATIKKAFKKLARKYHPDRNKAASAAEKFKEINAANDLIGDPDKRKLYDEFGEVAGRPGFDPDQARGFRGGFPGGGPGGAGFGRGFPGGFGGFHQPGGSVDFEDLLSSMFGSGGGTRHSRGQNRQVEVSIPFLTTVLGGDQSVRVPQPDGSRETVRFRVPAGARSGGRLTIQGQGLPPTGGGPCGDLIVKLQVADHPHLRRIEDTSDLEMDLPITVLEAMEGAAITVPTPTGAVKVTVPKGADTGTRMRLRGKGMQTTPPGDLYLVLRPTVPKSDDPGVLMAARRLEEAYVGDLRGRIKI